MRAQRMLIAHLPVASRPRRVHGVRSGAPGGLVTAHEEASAWQQRKALSAPKEGTSRSACSTAPASPRSTATPSGRDPTSGACTVPDSTYHSQMTDVSGVYGS
jgi:hypothetical protein